MTPTIEDVLEKHLPEFHDTTPFLKSRIYAAMQEWASLQTPSNEKYGWVKASEREPKIGDYYYCKVDTKQDCIVKTIVEWGKHKNGEFEYDDWDLDNVAHFGDFGEDADVIEWLDESTPIPIPTPCVELEKEVERLKGLIKQRERSSHYTFYSDASTMTDHQIEKQFKERWETFKTENNL